MCDEGWARMCLTIPVTYLASRSASAGTRAEGTGTGAHGQASDAAASCCSGIVEAPRCLRGRAGGQRCLLQSQTAASFQGEPGVCLWLWSSRAASFPLVATGSY